MEQQTEQILPWQAPIWTRFQQQISQQRMPHALLLHGPGGTGKGRFATLLAQRLLCSSPTPEGFACGQCRSCKLQAAATHPDLIRLHPDEGKTVLAVDQVRAMVEEFAYTPQIAQRKVVVVEPAESMNVNAANSLLKTLEEPPGEAVMLLLSHTPARLLPTIRSRCQQIAFPLPNRVQSLQWLQQQLEQGGAAESLLELAEGAPLKALSLSQAELLQHYQQMGDELMGLLSDRADPIRVALRWSDKKLDPTLTLRWLQQWVAGLIKMPAQRRATLSEPLLSLSQRLQAVDRRRLFLFYDKVSEALTLSTTPVNKELLFEGVLLEWSSFR
jgi:DNA polymerase-3 subunit delta'